MDRRVRLQNYHRQLSTSLKSLDEIAREKKKKEKKSRWWAWKFKSPKFFSKSSPGECWNFQTSVDGFGFLVAFYSGLFLIEHDLGLGDSIPKSKKFFFSSPNIHSRSESSFSQRNSPASLQHSISEGVSTLPSPCHTVETNLMAHSNCTETGPGLIHGPRLMNHNTLCRNVCTGLRPGQPRTQYLLLYQFHFLYRSRSQLRAVNHSWISISLEPFGSDTLHGLPGMGVGVATKNVVWIPMVSGPIPCPSVMWTALHII